ncbi:unnamed protein product [Auanema sp. JU1783]|nr:unnamed protein product [Auanema sp. JU1783]
MLKFLTFFAFVQIVLSTAPGTNGDISNPVIKKDLENEAKIYLSRFGYLAPKKDEKGEYAEPSTEDMEEGLKKFQKSFLFYSSGMIDVPTQAKFSEYRCANRDMFKGNRLKNLPKSELWNKKVLLWNITSYPSALSQADTREACEEAFEKWHKVTGIKFIQVVDSKSADIVISFQEIPDSFMNVAAAASKPKDGLIMFDKNRLWGYRKHIPTGISLFHSLLHEIGHSLGLHHSFYRGSIMFPIFKPALVPFGTLDDVPTIDRIKYRHLYGVSQDIDNEISPVDTKTTKCISLADSVSAVSPSEWLLFRGSKVYNINEKKLDVKGRNIQDVFPKGPEFVNATVSTNGLFFIFTERTIYGYEFDGVTFTEARDFPRELHERVLFYPQGAFPMNNGSVILMSGNVFATYDVMENAPSFLNDKNRFFPHLPEDLRSGIPKDSSFASYWMFDESTVTHYDMIEKQSTQVESLPEFFKCSE